MKNSSRVRIPTYNVDDAVALYVTTPCIRRTHIMELFHVSTTTAGQLKKLAEIRMREKGISIMDSCSVSVDAAYEAWGIDIADLIRRQRMREQIERRRGRPSKEATGICG